MEVLQLRRVLDPVETTVDLGAPEAESGTACHGRVFVGVDGRLAFEARDASDRAPRSVNHPVFEVLSARPSVGPHALVLVPYSDVLFLVNGEPVRTGLAVVHPGDLLTIAPTRTTITDWMLVRHIEPRLAAVESSRADDPCPLCGMELSRGSVVACPCGTIYHQESGPLLDGTIATPDDPLDCFTRAEKCITCGADLSLEPRVVPDPRRAGLRRRERV